jgi:WhiB family transcriptional regulator, redox-sensing transcriptional regulator
MAPQADPLPTALEEILNRPAWQKDAACNGAGTESFMPGRGGSFKRARELCAACLVRDECLSFALADDELEGMWAGTTDRERREMRRRSVA